MKKSKEKKQNIWRRMLWLTAIFVVLAGIGAVTGPAFAEEDGISGQGVSFEDNGRYKITFKPFNSPGCFVYSDLEISVYDSNGRTLFKATDGMGEIERKWQAREFTGEFDGRRAARVEVSCYYGFRQEEQGQVRDEYQGTVTSDVDFGATTRSWVYGSMINRSDQVYLGELSIEAVPYDIWGKGTVRNRDSGEEMGTITIPGSKMARTAFPGQTVKVIYEDDHAARYRLKTLRVTERKTGESWDITPDRVEDNQNGVTSRDPVTYEFNFTMPASAVDISYGQMEPQNYIDTSGEEATCDDYTFLDLVSTYYKVSEKEMILRGGWYVLEKDLHNPMDGDKFMEVEKRIICQGDVNIILCDGSRIDALEGIEVNDDKHASLTIWAQKEGSGQLNAYSVQESEEDEGAFAAAIGGGKSQIAGPITINGGNVTADASSKLDYSDSDIPDGGEGAGIGGGSSPWKEKGPTGFKAVTINRGTVTAIGSEKGAGIGCGRYSKEKGTITINGGTVTASGGGAGIGTGSLDCSGFGKINIQGGSVTATCLEEDTAGIGGLAGGDDDVITISKGTVNATGCPGIGVTSRGKAGKVVIEGGNITAQGSDYGAGLRAPSLLVKNGTVTATGDTDGAGIGGAMGMSKDLSGTVEIRGGKVTATGGKGGAGIGGASDGNLADTVKISGGTVNATGRSGGAGIGGGDSGSLTGTVTISGGTVTARAEDDGAGIGGGDGKPLNGTVTVTKGKVYAYGGDNGAGIGSGQDCAQIGTVTVRGGEVHATGGDSGAGVGGGDGGNGGTVNVYGGTLYAAGGDLGAGIGGGDEGNGGILNIHKGSVQATSGGAGAGVGGGYAGEAGKVTLYDGGLLARATEPTGIYGGAGGAGIGCGGMIHGIGSRWPDPQKSRDAFFTMYKGSLHATGATGAAGIGGSWTAPGFDVKIMGGESFIMCGINLSRTIGAGVIPKGNKIPHGSLEIGDGLQVNINGYMPAADNRITTIRTSMQISLMPCKHTDKAITHTEAGHTVTCAHCNAFPKEEQPHVAGKTADIENRIEPTCTEKGSFDLMSKCEVCGEKMLLKKQELEPLGHQWNKGEVTKEATVSEEGSMLFTCKRCEATRTEVIPKLGPDQCLDDDHVWDTGRVISESGCETKGLRLYQCQKCNAVRTEEIDVLGHTQAGPEEIPVRSVSCDRPGYACLFYYCGRCGDRLTTILKPIPAMGHDWGDWESFDDEMHQRICSRDKSHTELEAHTWDDGVVIEKATEQKEGTRRFTCGSCGVVKTEAIPAHDGSSGGSGGGSEIDAVQTAVDLIDALTPPYDEAKVRAAREAYDQLTDEQKADERLTEELLKKLSEAEAAVADAKDKAAAARVSQLIAALPDDPAKAGQSQVAEAAAAYKALSASARALIKEAELEKLQTAYNYPAASQTLVLKKAKARKGRKVLAKWTKNAAADGYQLFCKAKGVKAKKTLISSPAKLKKVMKKLRAGKKYTFKVRTYTEVENLATGTMTRVYGKWSNKKKVKAKK